MDPYLSIIVPIYKEESYLRKCIDSILAQTFQDFELILVDDGSPDNCPEICEKYRSLDSRIKVIHKINGGHTSARKAGLKIARGEYVGFVDGDDWIELNMYESLCKAAMQNTVDIVICDLLHNYCDREVQYDQSIKPGLYHKEALERDIYPYMLYMGTFYKFGLIPSPCNKIFRRTLVNKYLSMVDETILVGEDAAFVYPSLLDADKIFILDQQFLYHYRQTTTNITKGYDSEFYRKIILLYRYLKQIFNEKRAAYMENQLYYYLLFLIIQAIDQEYAHKNQRSKSEKKKLLRSIISNQDIERMLKTVSIRKFPLKIRLYTLLLKHKQIGMLHLLISSASKVSK